MKNYQYEFEFTDGSKRYFYAGNINHAVIIAEYYLITNALGAKVKLIKDEDGKYYSSSLKVETVKLI